MSAPVLAGLVNAHTHVYSALAPYGMPAPAQAPENFVQILERIWWRLDRALDVRALDVSSRLYVAESLLHGATVLVDHHESPNCIEGSLDVIASACEALGMRALVCFGATERNGGRDEARRGLAECRRFILSHRQPLVRGAIGLHASFTVSDETIREAGDLCRDLGAVLHVHLAEDVADVEDARARGFAGPLQRLIALGALVPGSVLAHGVHLSADEVRMAEDAGAWLVQNARSNRGNRVGYPRALTASRHVALGTDGYPSHMLEEAEAAAATGADHGEAAELSKTRLAAGWTLASAIFGPALADPARPGATSGAALAAARDACLARYDVNGRPVLRAGRLVTADIDALRDEARVEAARLWRRLDEVT